MFERILVAFDGTEHSRPAVRVALELAARLQSQLTVVTVHPPTKEPTDGHLESLVPVDPEGRSLATLLNELESEARERKVPSFSRVFLQGEVVPSILGYLKDHPHDLLVTGSRGLSRGRRLLLGSVSSGLVGGAPCPVLVARLGPTRSTPSTRAPASGSGAHR